MEMNYSKFTTKISSKRKFASQKYDKNWYRNLWKGDHSKIQTNCFDQRLKEIINSFSVSNLRILEVGMGIGDLLTSFDPIIGIWVDNSYEKIKQAKNQYPHFQFLVADTHHLGYVMKCKFDVIILSNIVTEVWNAKMVFRQIFDLSHEETRIIIICRRSLVKKLSIFSKLKNYNNKLSITCIIVKELFSHFFISNFETLNNWTELGGSNSRGYIKSINTIPILSFIVKHLWGQANYIIAKPLSKPVPKNRSVSVIIPARNEAGNIPQLFKRIPKIAEHMELVFVEGHSTDDTYATILQEMANNPNWTCQLLSQDGIGKRDAVRIGFEKARGEILIILDADLTVCPEELEYFYFAIAEGKGELINGVRFLYPMEKGAMDLLSYVGNKLFALMVSWLIGYSINDTLCGTKAILKKHYLEISGGNDMLSIDPFGDFDLLIGAAKHNLKILDMPVRYSKRTYGKSNINRWKHGWMLIKLLIIAIISKLFGGFK